jgi:hypothetical protein
MKNRCEFFMCRVSIIHCPFFRDTDLYLLYFCFASCFFVLSIQTVYRTLALGVQYLAALAAASAAQDVGSQCARFLLSLGLPTAPAAASSDADANAMVYAATTATTATAPPFAAASAAAACSEQPVARGQSIPSAAATSQIMHLQT